MLDWNLWYTSPIESFISTMETSALAGSNVAKLIVNGWIGDRESNVGVKESSAGILQQPMADEL